MFRSFPLCLSGAGYHQSRANLNGNPNGRTTLKMGFPLPVVIYLAKNLSVLKTSCSFSFIDRELFCFPLIFSFLLSSNLWSGILLFLSFHFLFSFFSFLPFLTFYFSLSISFFGKSGFSIHYFLVTYNFIISVFLCVIGAVFFTQSINHFR